jgi:hypothetical protein
MQIVHEFSHLNALEALAVHNPRCLKEIRDVIAAIDAEACRTKVSKEAGMKDALLYAPVELNRAFRKLLKDKKRRWGKLRRYFDIVIPGHKPKYKTYYDVDFLKQRIAIEVQFGKYFALFNDMLKFQYFFQNGDIDIGVEIVPVKAMSSPPNMSSGVPYYEMLVGHLIRLNRTFPQVPIWVIGIAPEGMQIREIEEVIEEEVEVEESES